MGAVGDKRWLLRVALDNKLLPARAPAALGGGTGTPGDAWAQPESTQGPQGHGGLGTEDGLGQPEGTEGWLTEPEGTAVPCIPSAVWPTPAASRARGSPSPLPPPPWSSLRTHRARGQPPGARAAPGDNRDPAKQGRRPPASAQMAPSQIPGVPIPHPASLPPRARTIPSSLWLCSHLAAAPPSSKEGAGPAPCQGAGRTRNGSRGQPAPSPGTSASPSTTVSLSLLCSDAN